MRGARRALVWAVPVVIGLAVALYAVPRASGADDAAAGVKARLDEFVKAWNAHDAKGMAATWTQDGDLQNPFGRWAKGRAEVEKLFADEHGPTGFMRKSTFEVKSHTVRVVAADVAVLDAEVVVSGIGSPDGPQLSPQTFHLLAVDKKVGDGWFVFAGRPFMLAPQPPGKAPGSPR
jgi:uncharacterized protein (TIGR02246 family)